MLGCLVLVLQVCVELTGTSTTGVCCVVLVLQVCIELTGTSTTGVC